jgi:hypothetical protein
MGPISAGQVSVTVRAVALGPLESEAAVTR